MSCNIGSKFNSFFFSLYSKLNRTYPIHTILNLLVIKQSFFFLHFSCISYKILIDIFGGSSHEDFSLVVVLGEEIGQGPAVVEVGVGDDDHFNLLGVDFVEEGQAVGVLLVYHQPTVQHDLFLVDGEDEARPAYLAPRPQGQN